MAYSFQNYSDKSQKAIDHTKQDVAGLRTGRATAQMLDPVMVEAYGAEMRINEVANVQAPDASLIVVTPWDKSLMEAIEKGISKAGLNLNPVVDGDIIRIAVAPLTEEKRKEMVKQLKQKIEDGKIMLRSIRTQAKQEIEDMENQGGVSEDEVKRDLETLDKKLQDFIEELEALEAAKESELMRV